jgi:hypothetical protein
MTPAGGFSKEIEEKSLGKSTRNARETLPTGEEGGGRESPGKSTRIAGKDGPASPENPSYRGRKWGMK